MTGDLTGAPLLLRAAVYEARRRAPAVRPAALRWEWLLSLSPLLRSLLAPLVQR